MRSRGPTACFTNRHCLLALVVLLLTVPTFTTGALHQPNQAKQNGQPGAGGGGAPKAGGAAPKAGGPAPKAAPKAGGAEHSAGGAEHSAGGGEDYAFEPALEPKSSWELTNKAIKCAAGVAQLSGESVLRMVFLLNTKLILETRKSYQAVADKAVAVTTLGISKLGAYLFGGKSLNTKLMNFWDRQLLMKMPKTLMRLLYQLANLLVGNAMPLESRERVHNTVTASKQLTNPTAIEKAYFVLLRTLNQAFAKIKLDSKDYRKMKMMKNQKSRRSAIKKGYHFLTQDPDGNKANGTVNAGKNLAKNVFYYAPRNLVNRVRGRGGDHVVDPAQPGVGQAPVPQAVNPPVPSNNQLVEEVVQDEVDEEEGDENAQEEEVPLPDLDDIGALIQTARGQLFDLHNAVKTAMPRAHGRDPVRVSCKAISLVLKNAQERLHENDEKNELQAAIITNTAKLVGFLVTTAVTIGASCTHAGPAGGAIAGAVAGLITTVGVKALSAVVDNRSEINKLRREVRRAMITSLEAHVMTTTDYNRRKYMEKTVRSVISKRTKADRKKLRAKASDIRERVEIALRGKKIPDRDCSDTLVRIADDIISMLSSRTGQDDELVTLIETCTSQSRKEFHSKIRNLFESSSMIRLLPVYRMLSESVGFKTDGVSSPPGFNIMEMIEAGLEGGKEVTEKVHGMLEGNEQNAFIKETVEDAKEPANNA